MTESLVSNDTWGIPRTREVSWHDPQQFSSNSASMSGLEALTALSRGELPAAPITRLLNFRPTEVSFGRVVFVCELDESMFNPMAIVHGGVACTLADTVIGCAVHTTLDAEHGYTSIDISVNYLRALTLDSGTLTATGTVTKSGRRVSFASAELTNGAGQCVATATGSCLILDRN